MTNSAILVYETRDGTAPDVSNKPAIIAHICNNLGGWGAGFVLAISKKWAAPEEDYRAWSKSNADSFALGHTRIVPAARPTETTHAIAVANMIAQNGYASKANPVAVDYDALTKCLDTVYAAAAEKGADVWMPKIGAGLGGGDWTTIAAIIEAAIVKYNVVTHVCTPEGM